MYQLRTTQELESAVLLYTSCCLIKSQGKGMAIQLTVRSYNYDMYQLRTTQELVSCCASVY